MLSDSVDKEFRQDTAKNLSSLLHNAWDLSWEDSMAESWNHLETSLLLRLAFDSGCVLDPQLGISIQPGFLTAWWFQERDKEILHDNLQLWSNHSCRQRRCCITFWPHLKSHIHHFCHTQFVEAVINLTQLRLDSLYWPHLLMGGVPVLHCKKNVWNRKYCCGHLWKIQSVTLSTPTSNHWAAPLPDSLIFTGDCR